MGNLWQWILCWLIHIHCNDKIKGWSFYILILKNYPPVIESNNTHSQESLSLQKLHLQMHSSNDLSQIKQLVNFGVISKKSPFGNVFLTITFQFRAFSHSVYVFTKNHFFQFTETDICSFKALHTITHIQIRLLSKIKYIIDYPNFCLIWL